MAKFIAVLGTGSAGMHHLKAFRAAGVTPIAVPIRSARRSDLASAGWSVAGDIDEAWKQGARSCVIATDTGRHVADALMAVGLGFNVLIEKPLSVDAGSAKRLLMFRDSRPKIFVACVLRFFDVMEIFRRRLPRVGQPRSIRVECRSYLPDWRSDRPYKKSYSARAAEGGVLRDLIHEIDYAGWLFGWPKELGGRLGNTGRLGIKSEEWAELVWDSNVGIVSIGLDYLTRPTTRFARVSGEKGTLEMDIAAQWVRWTSASGRTSIDRVRQARDDAFLRQAHAFLRVGSGKADARLATLQEGWRAVAICDSARRSSASRQFERVVAP